MRCGLDALSEDAADSESTATIASAFPVHTGDDLRALRASACGVSVRRTLVPLVVRGATVVTDGNNGRCEAAPTLRWDEAKQQ